MKNIALLIGVGVSCFLTGVIACYLWLHSQLPPAGEGGAAPAAGEVGGGGGGEVMGGANESARAAKFAALDTDQDGRLSLAEFSAGRGGKDAAKWFGRRDADKDGFLSKPEFLPFSAGAEGR